MPVSDILKLGYIKNALLTCLVLAFFSGCVTQNLDECPPEPEPDNTRQLLYLLVSDEVTRSDISQSEDLEDIMVYLFDRDEMLVDTIAYTISMIRNNIPIDLTERDLQGGFASVWADRGNSVRTDPVAFGGDIDSYEVSMIANDSRLDYMLCPGDMFFGYRNIAFSRIDEQTETDTVWLRRKNARLHITVRGLQETSDDGNYHFRIGTIYSAYNFRGIPQYETLKIWEQGEFNANREYVSPEPYIMIHNAPDHVYTESSRVVVEFYRNGTTGADLLIASTGQDTSGDYIHLEQGKTTNVLIVLDEATGQIEIRMEITPWDEIHQWTFW